MKKIMIFLLILLLSTLCSCKKIEEKPPSNNENREINKTLDPYDWWNKDEGFTPFRCGVYTNEYFGFQLTFPESWDNHYVIYQYDRSIQICFTGEGEDTRTRKDSFFDYPVGKVVFVIGTELSVHTGNTFKEEKKIGTVSNTDFWYYTTIDNSVGEVFLFDDEASKRDCQTIEKMQQDIPKILASFKSIREKPIVPRQEIDILQGGAYVNEDLGFELTFPENWAGYYIIQKRDESCIDICFYGESKWGRYFNEASGINGLPMFEIATEEYLKRIKLPSYYPIKKIGTTNGVDYYLFRERTYDYVLQSTDIDKTLDEEGLTKNERDRQKVEEMHEDEDTVLASFKAIK